MTDPRYGSPPGFGGGYDEPPLGEFQPGDETGVVDPNLGRYGGRINAFLSRVPGIGDLTLLTAGIQTWQIRRGSIDEFKLLPSGGTV